LNSKANDEIQVIENSTNEIKPQILTLDIPLNDTSSAGLGITLKGKTSIIDGQSIDLGIFVKSILTGGAASRVYLFQYFLFIFHCLVFRIIDFILMINFWLLMIHH
jgi:hypothetical protein